MANPRRIEELTDDEYAALVIIHREEDWDGPNMDCAICLDEWAEISGKPWGEA